MNNSIINRRTRIVDDKLNYGNDRESKLFLSNKAILAMILGECFKEFKDMSKEDIIQCIDPNVIVTAVHLTKNEIIISSSGNVSNDDVTNTEDIDTFISNEITLLGSIMMGTDTMDPTVIEGLVSFNILFYVTVPQQLDKNNNEEKNTDKKSKCANEQPENAHSKIRRLYSIFISTVPRKEFGNTILGMNSTSKVICHNGEKTENKSVEGLTTSIVINLGNPYKVKKSKTLRTLNVIFSKETSLEQKLAVLEENDIQDEYKEELKQRIINM